MDKEKIIQSLKDKAEEWKQNNIQSAKTNHYEDEDMEFGIRQGREECIGDIEELLNSI